MLLGVSREHLTALWRWLTIPTSRKTTRWAVRRIGCSGTAQLAWWGEKGEMTSLARAGTKLSLTKFSQDTFQAAV